MSKIQITGQLGLSGSRRVFLGFADAALLHRISTADVLDEDTGVGYQRRFSKRHSVDFRRYIQRSQSTTIPLTFNLRARNDDAWSISGDEQNTTLTVDDQIGDVFFQVDGQHRLGHLVDVHVPLAFMTFIELSPKEEMEIFSTINGKAKGLSTSLLDYHEAQLAKDLEKEKPELFIALRLHENEDSPWHKQLDLGGRSTSGLQRRASLRTMQKGVRRFLQHTNILSGDSATFAYQLIQDFWISITVVLEEQWEQPRKHFLTKGIGVYALMSIAADLYLEAVGQRSNELIDRSYFTAKLSDFAVDFDWSNSGPLKGLGGEAGATEAVHMLRELRKRSTVRVITGSN